MRGQTVAKPLLKLFLIHGDGATVIGVIIELRRDSELARSLGRGQHDGLALTHSKAQREAL